MTEDITWLLPTHAHLGPVNVELHVHTIVRDRYMCPLVGYVTSIGVYRSHFVGAVSFKGEKEAGFSVSIFAHCLDAKQPASVTGGIEAFVVQAWKEKEENVINMSGLKLN